MSQQTKLLPLSPHPSVEGRVALCSCISQPPRHDPRATFTPNDHLLSSSPLWNIRGLNNVLLLQGGDFLRNNNMFEGTGRGVRSKGEREKKKIIIQEMSEFHLGAGVPVNKYRFFELTTWITKWITKSQCVTNVYVSYRLVSPMKRSLRNWNNESHILHFYYT